MSIVHYRQLREKGFRAIIAFEIAKLGKRSPVFPKEEFVPLAGKSQAVLCRGTIIWRRRQVMLHLHCATVYGSEFPFCIS